MATRTTKLELSQLLAQRNVEVEALRVRVAELEGNLEVARKTAAAPTSRVPQSTGGDDIVARWSDRSGQAWAKVRVGFNRYAIRQVAA